MGEVKMPGTYTLNSLSTAFNALYTAGGISDIGTLRDIKVYRAGRQIASIDVYDYILNGNSSGDVRLQDNDIIVVGSYDCLVRIKGKVKRPMFYEMKSSESVSTILSYAGGFTGDEEYLVRRSKDEEPWGITVGHLLALTERLAWLDDEKADKIIFQFPYPELELVHGSWFISYLLFLETTSSIMMSFGSEGTSSTSCHEKHTPIL